MNKLRIIKITIFIYTLIIISILMMSQELYSNKVNQIENQFGKQDFIISKINESELSKVINSKELSEFALSTDHPDKSFDNVQGKSLYNTMLVDVTKSYFNIFNYSVNGKFEQEKVVIGERLARYLNTKIGETISCSKNGEVEKFYVAGIYKNKPFMDDSDNIYRIKKTVVVGNRTNIAVVLKKKYDPKKYIQSLKIDSKVVYNNPLLELKNGFNKKLFLLAYFFVVTVMLTISLIIITIIYNENESFVVGVKRLLGASKIRLISWYIKTYSKIGGVTILVSAIFSILISKIISIILIEGKLNFSIKDFFVIIVAVVLIETLLILTQYIYIKRVVKSDGLKILFEKQLKEKKIKKYKSSVKSKRDLFFRYYNISLIKNIAIISVICILGSHFYKLNYTFKMDNIIYNQHKEFEGNDYDYAISVNPNENTNRGINNNLVSRFSESKDVSYVKASRNAYGMVEIDKGINFDKKYFYEVSTASKYIEKVLKGIIFEDGGKTYIKSEIIGVNDEYMSNMEKSVTQGKIRKSQMNNGRIIAVYIPKFGDDEKNKVDYRVGDEVNLLMPINGDASEKYFKKNKISVDMKKVKYRISAILSKPPLVSDIYSGPISVVPVMSMRSFDKVIGNNVIREIKIKYKDNITNTQKEKNFYKIYGDISAPGVTVTNYLMNQEETFKSVKQDLMIKNFILILMIVLVISAAMISLVISIKKRSNEYKLLYIIGFSKKNIKFFIFIENMINYIISSLITFIACRYLSYSIFMDYKDNLLNKNIENGLCMSLIISSVILIFGFLGSIGITTVYSNSERNKD